MFDDWDPRESDARDGDDGIRDREEDWRDDRDRDARERDDERASLDPRDVFMRDLDLPRIRPTNPVAKAPLDVPAGARLFRVRDIDLDAPARHVRRQRPPPRRPSARVAAHQRLARVHLDRLGDGPRRIRQLLQRELELPRIDPFGSACRTEIRAIATAPNCWKDGKIGERSWGG